MTTPTDTPRDDDANPPGGDAPHDRTPDTLLARVEHAAIEAELATGGREETEAQARSHVLVRMARMAGGFVLLVVGIIAIPLPGPGWLLVAAGLALLARDVAWADRLLRLVRRRVPGVPEDGRIPRSTLVTVLLLSLAFAAVSTWWALR